MCSIRGCEKRVLARTWCAAHYQRWYKHGDPEAGRTKTGVPGAWLVERLDQPFGMDCVEWPFALTTGGYGVLSNCSGSDRVTRQVWELLYGPTDLDILHSCDNPPCFNPNHLEAGGAQKNVQDSYDRRRREPQCQVGVSNGNSKLRELDVKYIRELSTLGHFQKDIAAEFDITQAHVSEIVRRVSWAHVT